MIIVAGSLGSGGNVDKYIALECGPKVVVTAVVILDATCCCRLATGRQCCDYCANRQGPIHRCWCRCWCWCWCRSSSLLVGGCLLLRACTCPRRVSNGNTAASRPPARTQNCVSIRNQMEARRQPMRLWNHVNDKYNNDRRGQYYEFAKKFHRNCSVWCQCPKSLVSSNGMN